MEEIFVGDLDLECYRCGERFSEKSNWRLCPRCGAYAYCPECKSPYYFKTNSGRVICTYCGRVLHYGDEE